MSIKESRFKPVDLVIGTNIHSDSINANNSATELGEKSASTTATVPGSMFSDDILFFQNKYRFNNHSYVKELSFQIIASLLLFSEKMFFKKSIEEIIPLLKI